MAETKLGKVGLTPKGEWNSSASYEQLDLVSYDGGSWVAKKANTNVTPRANDCWMQVGARGNQGIKGDTGSIAKPGSTFGSLEYITYPLSPWAKGNGLIFIPPEQVIMEQTVDGGVTWTSMGKTDVQKKMFMSCNGDSSGILAIPKNGDTSSSLCGIRLTITAGKFNVPEGTAETDKFSYWTLDNYTDYERYFTIYGFYIWVTSSALDFTVETSTLNAPDTWKKQPFTSTITGSSGGNFVAINGNSEMAFGGYTGQNNNNWFMRLTFFAHDSSSKSNQYVWKIATCGGATHVANTVMHRNGVNYKWDYDQNTIFPAKLYANNGYEVYDEKPFKLIEQITLTEDAILTRTTKPDGTAYNFRAAFVKLNHPAGSAIQKLAPIVYMYNAYYVGYTHYGVTSTTVTSYGMSYCYAKNGYWWSERSYPSGTDSFAYSSMCYSGDGYTLKKSVASYPCINKIASSAEIVAGTTIEIWAVDT